MSLTKNASRTALALCLASTSVLIARPARADEAAPVAATPAPAPASPGLDLRPQTAPLVPPAPDAEAARLERGRFSGRRFVVNMLVGAVVGSAVSYGTFSALCHTGDDCFMPTLGAVLANFAVTPLATWTGGRLQDGQGTLLSAYLGAAIATTPLGVQGPAGETTAAQLTRMKVELIVSTLLLPVTSSLFYEVSSNMAAQEKLAARKSIRVVGFDVVPTVGSTGALGTVALTF